jgi:dihydroorotate dehydrogenase (NAD+) catalytic subunit
MDLRVRLGPLTLNAPVLAAAGTVGYGTEFAGVLPLERLGAIVLKTVTRTPRDGNPPPRLAETPSGMLNAVGLQNVGLDALISEKLPALAGLNTPVIASILADTPEELAEMSGRLDGAARADAIEVNLSCPNVRHAGQGNGRHVRLVAHDPDAVAAMMGAARKAARKPLIAKLSPDVTDLTPIAQAAERAGADALCLGNTYVGMSIDPSTWRSRLGTMTGGLSGPAIRPLTVYRLWYTAQTVRIPVIGLGGVVRAEDALELLLAGAAAVGVGTATFADPRAALRVVDGIERYCRRRRIESLQALRGVVGATQ